LIKGPNQLDERIPIEVRIEVIVIDGELTTEVIHDVWGSQPACFVYADRRIMGFRRRPGSDEPDAQVIEDGPDHRWIFDATADRMGPGHFGQTKGSTSYIFFK
jgi:hypothetical protein